MVAHPEEGEEAARLSHFPPSPVCALLACRSRSPSRAFVFRLARVNRGKHLLYCARSAHHTAPLDGTIPKYRQQVPGTALHTASNLAQPYEFSMALTIKQEHNHTTSTAIPRTPRLKLVDRKPTRSRK